MAYHWEYFDHYKDKREYVKIWYAKNRRHIDEGIALGKREWPLGPGQLNAMGKSDARGQVEALVIDMQIAKQV